MWDDDKLEETEIEEYESEQEEYPGGQELYQMDAPQQKRRQDKPSGNGSRDGQRSGNRAARPRKSSAARERAEREARREAQQRMKKKRRRRRIRRVFMLIFLILLLLVVAAGGLIWSKLSKMQRASISDDQIVKNTMADGKPVNLKGYTNIALFGVDARDGSRIGKEMHADTDIVLSINNLTGEIRLISVYRDTYLNVNEADDMYRKLTEGFYYYGPEEAMNALNRNLDLDIEDYVAVNWAAVANAINILGGVEIDVTAEELPYLNGYCTETSASTGIPTTQLAQPGLQTLDGVQAVSYCRIRYIGMDYQRTERQRTVLSQMFTKMKHAGVGTLMRLVDEILPQVSTSLSGGEMTWMGLNLFRYHLGTSMGFPYDKVAMTVPGKNDCVVPKTLLSNVTRLHEEMFPGLEYTPSAKVQQISQRIISDTGVQ